MTKHWIAEHIGTWDDLLALWWIIPLDCMLLILGYKALWWITMWNCGR